jgi:hypothetical protein
MIDQRISISIISAIAGALIMYWFFYPQFETKTEIVEVRTSDTVYIEIRDTIRLTKKEMKQEYIRDTVLVDFKPQIEAFTASTPFLYGNTYVNGEVLGEVLKMDITNDFKIPQVTNTVTRTETNTIIKKPRGLYLGAGVTQQLNPLLKADYLDDQFIFSYQYHFQNGHAIGISKKLF